MTNVVAFTTAESIWMVADRRLTKNGKVERDDARKVMFLDASDGRAILGYMGLGSTASGTEPVDWMSNVLRGRDRNLSLEQALGVLADAAKRELPPHLVQLSGTGPLFHSIVATAFVGSEPKLYTIDLVFAPDRKTCWFRYTRHVNQPHIANRTPELTYGGSGYLMSDKRLKRDLRRIVTAYNQNRVTAQAVADQFARVNYLVSQSEPTVGERCIVAWRNRKGGIHRDPGAQQFYTKLARDRDNPGLPTISHGCDVQALLEVVTRHWVTPALAALQAGQPVMPEIDRDKINADLATLPDRPVEKLR